MKLVEKKQPAQLNDAPDMNYFYQRIQSVLDECKNIDIYIRHSQMALMTRRLENFIIALENGEEGAEEEELCASMNARTVTSRLTAANLNVLSVG